MLYIFNNMLATHYNTSDSVTSDVSKMDEEASGHDRVAIYIISYIRWKIMYMSEALAKNV